MITSSFFWHLWQHHATPIFPRQGFWLVAPVERFAERLLGCQTFGAAQGFGGPWPKVTGTAASGFTIV
jgi:hypothetical protein